MCVTTCKAVEPSTTPGQRSGPVAAEHDHGGVLCLPQENSRGRARDQFAFHRDLGRACARGGHGFVEQLVTARNQSWVNDYGSRRDRHVVQPRDLGVHDLQAEATTHGLLCGPLDRTQALGGPRPLRQ